MAIAGVVMFATFLFLTYYLQHGLGFSPIESGLAFLPMVLAIFATAPAAATKLLPRVGPRPLVPSGMIGPLRRGRRGPARYPARPMSS